LPVTSLRPLRSTIESQDRRRTKGLHSIFDRWLQRVLTQLLNFDPSRAWGDSVRENALRSPAQGQILQWDLQRLRQFLDRWRQGRFVDYLQRERSGVLYHPRFGTEFGADVLLTCKGAPSLMRWRGVPLMKNVFDFAMYPMLLAELRPQSIFEVGSGLGTSAAWLADTLLSLGITGNVHSVDLTKAQIEHSSVTYHQGDCSNPERLFDLELLRSATHPWLVVEDAHHNVEAVLLHLHRFLVPGDYLVVEDSDVKREDIRGFLAMHPGNYLVDTKFTDNFGRNATCAADSILVRTKAGNAGLPAGRPARMKPPNRTTFIYYLLLIRKPARGNSPN
jgi:cephalosporin hydroxylase